MKNKDFFLAMIVSVLLGLLVVAVIDSNHRENSKTTQVDSLSDDYYKKSLDSFFFDHSKIPDE